MCFSKMPSATPQSRANPEPSAAAYVSPEADTNSQAGAVTTRRKLLINPAMPAAPAGGVGLQIKPANSGGVRG